MNPKFIVTEVALMGRLNRVLAKRGLRLKTIRRKRQTEDILGRYYLLDTSSNTVVDYHISLTTYATDLGVLSSYEQVKVGSHYLTRIISRLTITQRNETPPTRWRGSLIRSCSGSTKRMGS